jgi:hypothetical protein
VRFIVHLRELGECEERRSEGLEKNISSRGGAPLFRRKLKLEEPHL